MRTVMLRVVLGDASGGLHCNNCEQQDGVRIEFVITDDAGRETAKRHAYRCIGCGSDDIFDHKAVLP